jgi:hypothetical protein
VPLPYPKLDRRSLHAWEDKLAAILWSEREARLVVLQETDLEHPKGTVREIKLPDTPAGPPAVVGEDAFVPLASGVVAKINLGSGKQETGPDWRTGGVAGSGNQGRCQIVPLGSGTYLAFDTSGGAVLFKWDAGGWSEIMRRRPGTRTPIKGAIAVGRFGTNMTVAAERDKLVLLDDSLNARRTWSLDGPITAGPWGIRSMVYAVVDGKRLIAVDPANDGVAWDVVFLTELIGTPLHIGDRLYVADVQGNLWAIDPATGSNPIPNDRPAFLSRDNVAPAVNPLRLGDDRMLIFWSDGTASTAP